MRSLLGKLSLLPLFFLVVGALPAQTNGDPYRGAWVIETPVNGSLILIVKRNARASYFWADTPDRNVYQGTWKPSGNAILLEWADGSSHTIEKDDFGYGIIHYDESGKQRYISQAIQVPKDLLGQWAKPPTKTRELAKDRDQAQGFFGTWKVELAGGNTQYVIVEPDRSSATISPNAGQTTRGLRGAWAKQGSELHIIWENGEYSILRQNDRGFTYKQIPANVIIEEDETEVRPAARTSNNNLPQDWLNTYKAEKGGQADGFAFSNRKSALAFYRGSWLFRRSEDKFERVEIGRFGGLSTSMDRSLGGDWLMNRQDIYMRWDNGIRQVLSPTGDGFVVYEYKPGRPLDGVPTRLYQAAPTDSSKLEAHLKGRSDVAKQMLAMAQTTGANNQNEKNGWGRTAMRWVWPFGEDTANISSDKILRESYEESEEDSDPWWWPFWSEKTEENLSVEDSTGSTEVAQSTPKSTSATADTPTPGEQKAENIRKKSNKKKKWYWPY